MWNCRQENDFYLILDPRIKLIWFDKSRARHRYAHGFVGLCFVVDILSVIFYTHDPYSSGLLHWVWSTPGGYVEIRIVSNHFQTQPNENRYSWDILYECKPQSTEAQESVTVLIPFVTPRHWIQQSWWRHQKETFSALLALCAGNSLVIGEFPSQRPATRSFGVSFDLRLNKWLSRQSKRRWFETPRRSLWRHCNDIVTNVEHGLHFKLTKAHMG